MMRSALLAFAAGLLGFFLAWSVWHVYVDHATFHQLLTALTAQKPRAPEPPRDPQ